MMNSLLFSGLVFKRTSNRLLARFANCESGATTSEYSFIAAAVVALAVAGVGTTRSGATVSAENTAATIEAQAPIFESLAEGQQSARHAWRTQNTSPAGRVSAPRTTQPSRTSVENQSKNTATEQTADTNTQQTAENQSDETTSKASPNAGAKTTKQAGKNDKATAKNGKTAETANKNNSRGSKSASGKTDTDEKTVVANTSKPGCKNPYNKKGKIKKKCRG